MERLLYESGGTPAKRARLLRICGGVLIVCGMALMMLGMAAPSYVDGKGMIIFMGIATIGIGITVCALPMFDFASKAYLRLYESYVEGRQVGPTREFRLNYTEIYNVRKKSMMGNDFVVIEGAQDSYAVLVNDQDQAFRIINGKLDELEKV